MTATTPTPEPSTVATAAEALALGMAGLLAAPPPPPDRVVTPAVELLLRQLALQGRLDAALRSIGYQAAAPAPPAIPQAVQRSTQSVAAAGGSPTSVQVTESWQQFMRRQHEEEVPLADAVQAAVTRYFDGQRPPRALKFNSRVAAIYSVGTERVRQCLAAATGRA